MKTRRLKTIPDRTFHILWDSCKSAESEDEYIRKFMSPLSADFINFYRKYNIPELDARKLLQNTYRAFHMSFKEIITAANLKPSQASHLFCIPIRTIEDWKAGKNPCPAYIRLMFLRHFYLIDLGKYITLESELLRKELKPAVYRVKKQAATSSDIKRIKINKAAYLKLQEELDKDTSTSPVEEIIKRTDYLKVNRMK